MQSETDPNYVANETASATDIFPSVHAAMVVDAYHPGARTEAVRIQKANGKRSEDAKGRQAVLHDINKGTSWSDRSIAWFKHQYHEAANPLEATDESIMQRLEIIRKELEHQKKSKIPWLILAETTDKFDIMHFFIALQKDPQTEKANIDAMHQGRKCSTVIELGAFSPYY